MSCLRKFWCVIFLPTLLLLCAAAPRPDLEPLLGKHYYGVYLLGQKVGYGSSELSRTRFREKAAWRALFRMNFRLAAMGKTQEMTAREERIYLPGEGLAAFTSENESLLGKTVIRGERKEGGYLVDTSGGKKFVPAPPEMIDDYLADVLLVKERAPAGRAVTTVQFYPELLKPVAITHTVKKIEELYLNGVSTRVYRIESDLSELGIKTESVIDEKFITLKTSLGNYLTIREEEEAAAKNLNLAVDLLQLAAVDPSNPIPFPPQTRMMRIKLTGANDFSSLNYPPRQSAQPISPDSYYIRIVSQPLPPPDPPTLPITDPALQPYLRSTLFMQSDHPSIKRRSREIVGADKDSFSAAGKLVSWVNTSLGKTFLIGLPDALSVLEKKEGDCKAHSVLLVALARAAGLPARPVSGLVETGDGRFYYHQWAEIYAGRWLPVDPVFNQVPADATHIKLNEGGLSEQLKLANIIGSLQIEVLEFK